MPDKKIITKNIHNIKKTKTGTVKLLQKKKNKIKKLSQLPKYRDMSLNILKIHISTYTAT